MLNQLPKITSKGKKRVGRGGGSGKGFHTVGRGQKGQKTRNKIHPLFAGTKNKKSIIQRLPVLRGRNKFKPLTPKPIIINLDQLRPLPAKSVISVETLLKYKILSRPPKINQSVELLGRGQIDKAYTLAIPASETAKQKIEAAGGKLA